MRYGSKETLKMMFPGIVFLAIGIIAFVVAIALSGCDDRLDVSGACTPEDYGVCESIDIVYGTEAIQCLPEMEDNPALCGRMVDELHQCTVENDCDPSMCLCAWHNYYMICKSVEREILDAEEEGY